LGRKPLGARALTGAERVRLYRERHPKPPKETPEAARIRALEADLAAVRAELATAKAKPSPTPIVAADAGAAEKIATLERQLKAARTERTNLKQKVEHLARSLDAARLNQFLPDELKKALMVALHPDQYADEKIKRRNAKAMQGVSEYFGGKAPRK
jgi:hypothetical protein